MKKRILSGLMAAVLFSTVLAQSGAGAFGEAIVPDEEMDGSYGYPALDDQARTLQTEAEEVQGLIEDPDSSLPDDAGSSVSDAALSVSEEFAVETETELVPADDLRTEADLPAADAEDSSAGESIPEDMEEELLLESADSTYGQSIYLDPGKSLYVEDAELKSLHLQMASRMDPFDLMDVLDEDYSCFNQDLVDAGVGLRFKPWESDQWSEGIYRIRAWTGSGRGGFSSYCANTIEGGSVGGGDFALYLYDQDGQRVDFPCEQSISTGAFTARLEYYNLESAQQDISVLPVEESRAYQGTLSVDAPSQVTAASDAWKCFLFTAPANGRYTLHFTSGCDDVCIREYVEETKDSWVIKAREAGAADGRLKVDLPAGKRCLIVLKDVAEGSSTNVQLSLTAGAMLSDAQIVSLYGDTVDTAEILDFLKEGLQIRLTYEGEEEELLSVSDETCQLYDDGPSTGLLFADSRDNRYLLRFGTVSGGNTTWHALSAKPDLLAKGSIPAGEVQMVLYDYGEWKAADTGFGRSTADALASQPVTFEMPSAQYELTADEPLSIAIPASETAVADVSVSSSQGNPVFAAEARNGSYTLTVFKKFSGGLIYQERVTSDFSAVDASRWLTNGAKSGEFLAVIENTGAGDDVMDLRFLKRTRDVWMVSSIPESQHAATLRSILEKVQVKASFPTSGEETVSCAQFTEIHGGEEGSGYWLKGRLPSGYAAALYLMRDGEPVNFTDLDEVLQGGSYSFRLTLKLKQSIAADPGTWTFYTSYFSIVPEIDEVEIALPSGGTVSMADLTNYWWDNLQVTVSYDNETQETLNGRGRVGLVNNYAVYYYSDSNGTLIGRGYEDSYKTRYLLRFSSNYQTEDTGYKNLENGRYPAYNAYISLYYLGDWLEAEKKGYSALTRLRPIAAARIPIDMSAEELSEGTPLQLEAAPGETISLRYHADEDADLTCILNVTDGSPYCELFRLVYPTGPASPLPDYLERVDYFWIGSRMIMLSDEDYIIVYDPKHIKAEAGGDYILVLHDQGDAGFALSAQLTYIPEITKAYFGKTDNQYYSESFAQTIRELRFTVNTSDGWKRTYAFSDLEKKTDQNGNGYLGVCIPSGQNLALCLTDGSGFPHPLPGGEGYYNDYCYGGGDYALTLLEEEPGESLSGWKELDREEISVSNIRGGTALPIGAETTVAFSETETIATQWIDLRYRQDTYRLTITGSDSFSYEYWNLDDGTTVHHREELSGGRRRKTLYLEGCAEYFLVLWNHSQEKIDLSLKKVENSEKITSASLTGELGRTRYVSGFPVWGEPVLDGEDWEKGLYDLGDLGLQVQYQDNSTFADTFAWNASKKRYDDQTADSLGRTYELNVSVFKDGAPLLVRENGAGEDGPGSKLSRGCFLDPGTYAVVLRADGQLPGKKESGKWRTFTVITPKAAAEENRFDGQDLVLENPDDYYLFAGYEAEDTGYLTFTSDWELSFAKVYELNAEDIIPVPSASAGDANSFSARFEAGRKYLLVLRAMTAGQPVTLRKQAAEGIVQNAVLSWREGFESSLTAGVEALDAGSLQLSLVYENGEETVLGGGGTDRFGNSFRYRITDQTGQTVLAEDGASDEVRLPSGTYQVSAVHRIYENIQSNPVSLTVRVPENGTLRGISENSPFMLEETNVPVLFSMTAARSLYYRVESSTGLSFEFYKPDGETLKLCDGFLKAGETYVLVCRQNPQMQEVRVVPETTEVGGELIPGTWTRTLELETGYHVHIPFLISEAGGYALSITSDDAEGLALSRPMIRASGKKRLADFVSEDSCLDSLELAYSESPDSDQYLDFTWKGGHATLRVSLEKRLAPVSIRVVPKSDIRSLYWHYLASEDAGLLFDVYLEYPGGQETKIEKAGLYDLNGNTYRCEYTGYEGHRFTFRAAGRDGSAGMPESVTAELSFDDSLSSLNAAQEEVPQSVTGDRSGWQIFRLTAAGSGEYRISAGQYPVKIIETDLQYHISGNGRAIPYLTDRVILGEEQTYVIAVDTRELAAGESINGYPAFDLQVSRFKVPVAMRLKTAPQERLLPGEGLEMCGMEAIVTYADGTERVVRAGMTEDDFGNDISVREQVLPDGTRVIYLFCGDQAVSCAEEERSTSALPALHPGTTRVSVSEGEPVYVTFTSPSGGEFRLEDSTIRLEDSLYGRTDEPAAVVPASGFALEKDSEYVFCLYPVHPESPYVDITLIQTSDPCGEGHTWGDWVVQREADCLHDGQKVRYCVYCSAADTPEAIPATGEHVWTQTEPVVDEKAGTQTVWKECGVCALRQDPVITFTQEKQAELDAFAGVLTDGTSSLADRLDAVVQTDNQTLLTADTQLDGSEQTHMEMIGQLEQQLYEERAPEDDPQCSVIMDTIVDKEGVTVIGAAVTAAAVSAEDIKNGESSAQDTYRAVLRMSDPEYGTDDAGRASCTMDISLYVRKNEEEAQEEKTALAAPILITMAVPEAYASKDFDLYHHVENDDGSITKVKIDYSRNPDGTITFATPSLSDFSFENALCLEHQLIRLQSDSRNREAACTQGGVEVWGCGNPYCTYEEIVETKPLPHTWVRDAVLEATCTAEGSTGGWHCENCGCSDEEHPAAEPTEKTAHRWTQWSVSADALCETDGAMSRTCALCSEEERKTIPAIGEHSMKWKTVREATVFGEGTEEGVCSVCGRKESRSLPVPEPSMTVTGDVSKITLQKGKKTTAFAVSGMARGDSVRSWSSSDTKVFTVKGKSDGTCTIKAGKKTKKATLTIELASGLTRKITVKVQKAPVKVSSLGITNASGTLNLRKGESFSLKLDVRPFTTLIKPSYKSSRSKVASVSKKGVITAKKPGTAKITVKCGKKKKTITVRVSG